MASIGYINPDWPNPMGSNDARIIIYGYVPSIALASLGVALFTIATAIHLWLALRYRTWYFIPMVVGSVLEVVGYIFRCLSSRQDPYSIPWFVVQYFSIVVAPVFYSAAIYTIVSILIRRYGKEYAPVPPKLILGFFISCNVVATIIQIAGAALVGVAYSNQDDPSTASTILQAGLGIQTGTFLVFFTILAGTLWNSRRSSVHVSKVFLTLVIVATLAAYLRTCFRLAEGLEGQMIGVAVHEVYFGCLEFAPVVVAVYVLAYAHPGRFLRGELTEKTSSGG